MAVVRSLLPSRTLSVVRLVNRAARDEFVDGRCTRITPLWDDAPLSALAGAAPRLRSIVSLNLALSGAVVTRWSQETSRQWQRRSSGCPNPGAWRCAS